MSYNDPINEPVSILAVLNNGGLRRTIAGILSHSSWRCEFVNTWHGVVAAMQGERFGVVVSERELADGVSWREVLARTQTLRPSPRLIVTDPLADDRLWAEVVNLGAYDVLAVPLEREEVFRILSLAWLSWRDEQHRSATSHAAA